jgi:hypothetical protein
VSLVAVVGGGAGPSSVVIPCWRRVSSPCLVVARLSLVVVVFVCGRSSRVVVARSRWLVVVAWSRCPSSLSCPRVVVACGRCAWSLARRRVSWSRRRSTSSPCCVRGAALSFVGAGSSFARVVVCGCCLVGVICRSVGQDVIGKGGAHRRAGVRCAENRR